MSELQNPATNSEDDESEFEFVFHLSDDEEEIPQHVDVQSSDEDLGGEEFNPFDVPFDEEWDVDDPGVRQPQEERNLSAQNGPAALQNRPNGMWNINRLPTKFNKKPLQSRVTHNRDTYRVGAVYGGEDLSQVEEVDFEACDELCPQCGGKYWKAELTRARAEAGLTCLWFMSLKVNGEVKWHNHAYRDPGDETRPPNHGQVYFLDFSNDTEEEILEQRRQGLSYTEDVSDEVLGVLERYLRTHNHFIRAFQTTRELQQREEEKGRNEGREMRDVVLVINPKDPNTRVTRVGDDYVNRLLRGNQYSITPVADGIGAVFTGRLPPMSCDAMYFPRERREDEHGPGAMVPSKRTMDMQMFPLIYIHGETSHLEFREPALRGNRVPSLAEYYRYRLAIRDSEYEILPRLKKLYALYLLNAGFKVIYEWLSYRATHQSELKADSYKTLQKYIREEGMRQNRRIGKIVVLPPGICGTPRYMKDLFYDALAVSQNLGHPSWMITLTCNRKWKEIVDECYRTNTDPNYRYDVINRAFEMRATQLYSDIVWEQIFGKVVGKRPLSRRPNDGRGFFKRINGADVFVDNRWVIDYNVVLLLRYKGHLNVRYSPSTSGCKYFNGYLLKGSFGNKVRTSLVQKINNVPEGGVYDHDEIKEFKEMRHMGPYEAHYYVMGTSQSHIYPPVELNRRPGPHRGKVYKDVVENYKYEDQVWKRSNRHTIGRLSPFVGTDFNSELYHLRLLLCNRTDVTGFDNIKTVEGQVHPTFKAACVALNLVENEEEMRLLMDELVLEQFPSTIRKTFATLLVNVNPLNPTNLWDNYKHKMAEDHLHEIYDDDELCFQLALRDIAEILDEFGKTLADYQLPDINDDVLARQNIEHVEEDIILNPEAADELINGLNVEQRHFFEDVRGAVFNENQKKFFLTGARGTGKTHTYNVLIDFLRSRGKKAVVAAYTGVAANLLKGGLASHKAFGLPFEDEGLGLSRSHLKLQSSAAKNLLEANVIIWDEISMVQGWHLHVLDRFLRDLMRKEEPFGSKIIILGGDFKQILPVVPGGSRADIVDAAVTSSNLWPLFEKYELTRNQRALEDQEYAEWLLKVMTGSKKGETVAIFRVNFTSNEFSLPGKLRRRQFSLKPCYAMTVSKAQGQTLIRE
ncbi:hypothetical protein FOCC_FOCC013531, partial [Frankliniella occidentalis]